MKKSVFKRIVIVLGALTLSGCIGVALAAGSGLKSGWLQLVPNATWLGGSGKAGIYYDSDNNTFKGHKLDNSEISFGSGGGGASDLQGVYDGTSNPARVTEDNTIGSMIFKANGNNDAPLKIENSSGETKITLGPTNLSLAGSITGTWSIGGTPTLASALAVDTDGLNVGDATHRLDLFAATMDSGASTMALSSSTTGTNSFTLDAAAASTNLLKLTSGGSDRITIDRAGGNIRFHVNTAGILMPSGTTAISVVDGYGIEVANVRPSSDSTLNLGGASKRFIAGYFGAAAGSQATCDATTRGATMTVFATSGNSDTFEVCMKKADNSYAWVAVGTAP